jgi:hypothetical protein
MINVVTVISTATSGTITMPNTQQDVVLIHEAGVTASATIAFPGTPNDTQRCCVLSTAGITALTLSAAVGTIVNTITTLTAATPVAYMYSTSQNKWYKVT